MAALAPIPRPHYQPVATAMDVEADETKDPNVRFSDDHALLRPRLHRWVLHWLDNTLLDQDPWFGGLLKRVFRRPFWS